MTLNTIAVVFFALYTKEAYGKYVRAYYACVDSGQAVVDLLTMVTAVLGRRGRAARPLMLDFWRSANLAHAANYGALGRTDDAYSVGTFLLHFANAMGPYECGMLTQEERERVCAMADPARDAQHHRVAERVRDLFAARLYVLVRSCVVEESEPLTGRSWGPWGTALLRCRAA